MRASPNGLKLIQVYEGLGDGDKSTPGFEPYVCPAHIYTVGWGHALFTPDGKLIDVDEFGAAQALQLSHEAMQRKFGKQALSHAECDALLDQDMQIFETGIEKQIGAGNATQTQFDALTSFAYNVGLHNFEISALKQLHLQNQRQIGQIDLHVLFNAAQAKAAPTSMPLAFMRFTTANGQFALGLFRRRAAEMLVYSGWDAQKAFDTMSAFKG